MLPSPATCGSVPLIRLARDGEQVAEARKRENFSPPAASWSMTGVRISLP